MWWFPAVSLLGLGLVIYVASAAHVLSFSPLVIGRHASEREAAVREALADRPGRPTAGNRRVAPSILLRACEQPDSVSVEVPVPHDALLLDAGHRDGMAVAPAHDRALFTTIGDVATVLEFYRAQLSSLGWHEVRTFMSRPVIGAPGTGGAVSAFCRDADTPAILVGVVSRESGPSELRLLIDSTQSGPVWVVGRD